jgi:predicted metal-dependent phosphoesterase TrpH
MLADLHIHTTFSDGVNTPEDVVKEAVNAGLAAIAITDHDNIRGYERAEEYVKSNQLPLRVLRGVEIDTDYKGKDVHVLGYYFSPEDPDLMQALAWNRSQRVDRVQRIVSKIHSFGYPISFSEVVKEAAGSRSLGRPHIARLLVKKGCFKAVSEVFDTLIGAGKPCYLRQVKMSPKEAVVMLHNAGGIAVMAHPAELENFDLAEELLNDTPFDGMEVWHPSTLNEHPHHDWKAVAEAHHLIPSGGSDLHGNPGRFPMHLGEFRILYEDVKGIIDYKKHSN